MIVQRYIATRAMFMDAKEVQFTEGRRAVDAAEAITAMRSLGGLYKGILAAVRDEAVVMEQVFPSPGPAMAMLTHRIFEQRIQVGLSTMGLYFSILRPCRFCTSPYALLVLE